MVLLLFFFCCFFFVYPGVYIKCLWLQFLIMAYNLLRRCLRCFYLFLNFQKGSLSEIGINSMGTTVILTDFC